MTTNAVAVERSCPACAGGLISRGILVFKRAYLCTSHKATWDEQNENDLRRAARGRTQIDPSNGGDDAA